MPELSIDFKIGDHIKKVFDKNAIDKNAINKDKNNTIFKITNIKAIKGGNWHDGFTLSFIATIEPVLSEENVKPETDTEEYCIQYINYMCQINNTFAIKV